MAPRKHYSQYGAILMRGRRLGPKRVNVNSLFFLADIEAEKLDAYLPMESKPPASLSLPIHQRKISAPGVLQGSPAGCSTSQVSDYLPMSPVDVSRRVRPGSSPSVAADYLPMSPVDVVKKGAASGMSPSTDYLPMSPGDGSQRSVVAGSPGESAGRRSTDYFPMSPVDVSRVVHSRGSSNADDYVPMAPNHSDDGYVDMDPLTNSHHRFIIDGKWRNIASIGHGVVVGPCRQ